jgi:hypothetical protein
MHLVWRDRLRFIGGGKEHVKHGVLLALQYWSCDVPPADAQTKFLARLTDVERRPS